MPNDVERVVEMKRNEAASILKRYISLLFDRAGLAWTSYNDADMEALVDALIAAGRAR